MKNETEKNWIVYKGKIVELHPDDKFPIGAIVLGKCESAYKASTVAIDFLDTQILKAEERKRKHKIIIERCNAELEQSNHMITHYNDVIANGNEVIDVIQRSKLTIE